MIIGRIRSRFFEFCFADLGSGQVGPRPRLQISCTVVLTGTVPTGTPLYIVILLPDPHLIADHILPEKNRKEKEPTVKQPTDEYGGGILDPSSPEDSIPLSDEEEQNDGVDGDEYDEEEAEDEKYEEVEDEDDIASIQSEAHSRVSSLLTHLKYLSIDCEMVFKIRSKRVKLCIIHLFISLFLGIW